MNHRLCQADTLACQEHTPSNDGDEEVAGLRNKLEGAVEVEQSEDVLYSNMGSFTLLPVTLLEFGMQLVPDYKWSACDDCWGCNNVGKWPTEEWDSQQRLSSTCGADR